jgi:hypothetical protein
MNKWINETCPKFIEDKKDDNNINNNRDYKINMSNYENQNLTTEDDYIKNEFISINKRIDNIKNKLGMNINNKDNRTRVKKENRRLRFEFELSPIYILLFFVALLIIISTYSAVKNYIFNNKEHVK